MAMWVDGAEWEEKVKLCRGVRVSACMHGYIIFIAVLVLSMMHFLYKFVEVAVQQP